MILWHYTKGFHFPEILKSGIIKPATLYIPYRKPIVWFTANQYWEPTVNVLRRYPSGKDEWGTMQESNRVYGGLYRIGVLPETVPHDFRALKRLSGMPAKFATGLYVSAREQGSNPNEWRGTFKPVPMKKWVAVQRFDGSQWVDVE